MWTCKDLAKIDSTQCQQQALRNFMISQYRLRNQPRYWLQIPGAEEAPTPGSQHEAEDDGGNPTWTFLRSTEVGFVVPVRMLRTSAHMGCPGGSVS